MLDEPSKRINNAIDMVAWNSSRAKFEYTSFIQQLSESVIGKRIADQQDDSKIISSFCQMLDTLETWLDEYLPIQDETQRFGNKSFRLWIGRLEEDATGLITNILDNSNCPDYDQNTVLDLYPYFVNSFGNKTRIDYGSGHEMFFIIFLLNLSKLGVFARDQAASLVLILFNKYLTLVRKIQMYYHLEPAGSHGVWGLDDYQFLPYYFGSAQLINSETVPSVSINASFIHANSHQYLYISAIDFINKVCIFLLKKEIILNDLFNSPTFFINKAST
ncbi:Serine/threonine-protein phosphatase 2A activator [Smittium mucronatum]|uniref:Serine/threonine-protein phosphatase 2A activator n=1 Tax=Smittium mucronatum TaxID=133383 RepID=A0A1R0H3Q8_9FUNG|nr:Serine/threonine-protein phosphatase 2A activator [Smittium mucronatum]